MTPKIRLLLALALCALAIASSPVWAGGAPVQIYEVTVTNLTRGQIISPPVAIVHDGSFTLFTLGGEASPELAFLAEDAISAPLLALAGTMPSVFDTNIAAGGIPPGGSVTVEVKVRGRFRTVTVAGMLVTTNDAFFAGSTVARGNRGEPFFAPAYDAGSEGNTESCDHIPGPPCMNAEVRVEDSAEGSVHVHAGIHGIDDLVPSMHDWRNPTAYVTIKRLP